MAGDWVGMGWVRTGKEWEGLGRGRVGGGRLEVGFRVGN